MPVNLWNDQLFEDANIEKLEWCVDVLKKRGVGLEWMDAMNATDLSYAQGVVATTEE